MSAERFRSLLFAATCLLGALPGTLLATNELPVGLRDAAPDLQVHGSAVMRRFGFKLYTARLWTDQQGFREHVPYALDLEYALDIKATTLVATSIAEMRKQGHRDEAVLARWAQAMAVAFPDVRKGDRLIALAHPGLEARFYSTHGYLASIRDAAFVAAFFDIWLGAATSAPTLRAQLLDTRP